jgi:ABC-type uncharacterized transport system permease subunit
MVSPLVPPLVSLERLLWEIVFGVVLMPHGCTGPAAIIFKI